MDSRFQEPYSHPRWWYGGNYMPACFVCSYFRGMIRRKVRCTAFPDGIPKELTLEGTLHDTPFPGDNGIQFEQFEDGE